MVAKKTLWISGLVTLVVVVVVAVTIGVVLNNNNNSVSKEALEETLVETKLGKINGSIFKTRLDKKFIGFRGIRYAEPPIDNLRFQPPVAKTPWNETFDATNEGPACPQPTDWEVSEDCLRLNVYTSEIPRDDNYKLKPVFVWIHSGGLKGGSSLSVAAGGHYLLDRDVVLVTMNYRLASLGFMSTGTKEMPGNNGFKDQSMGLKWVRDNIIKFGGNPSSVTLMGQSAGARSVTLHMISPMSRGLFHRVILMSGGVTAQWKVPSHQLHLAKKQARILNCPDDDITEMVECLKSIDGVQIGETTQQFNEFINNPVVLWYPVIEPDFGQERFLTDDPTKLFRDGNFERVPIISGVTNDEFASRVPPILNDEEMRMKLNENFDELAPICFMYERDTQRSKYISKVLRDNFINSTVLTNSSFAGLNYLFSDGVVGFTVHRFVHLVSKYVKVFYYKNTYIGSNSNFYYPPGSGKPFGVSHTDDIIYFMKLERFPMIKPGDPESMHLEQILDIWMSFAVTGNPNNKTQTSLIAELDWVPFDETRENYLEIGEQLQMKNRLFLDRYQIWDSVFPLDEL
ncbi:unnamed protein product [Diamesa serratosioi]